MTEKYLLSVCYKNHKNEIFSEPFGMFSSIAEAETFADNTIDEMREDFCNALDVSYEELDEIFEFDFTIKKFIQKN